MIDNCDSNNVVEHDPQLLQQLIREAEEQRCHRYSLEMERQLERFTDMDLRSLHERDIRQLWSEISRVRRNDPSLSIWNVFLPEFYEPCLFRSWRQALQQSKHLQTLNLWSQSIVLEDVAKAVADGMKQTTVEELELKSTIDEEPSVNNWPIIYRGLQANQTIQQLTLTGVPIDYHAGDTLLLPKSLESLIINGATVTRPGAKALGRGIGQSKLESLTVRVTSEYCDKLYNEQEFRKMLRIRGSQDADLVCEALMETSCLTKLELHGGIWEEARMATLARGMKHNVSLKSLSLKQCVVNDDGADLLFCLGLKYNKTLTQLVLNGCGVGDDGIQAMTENWPATSSIQALTLINNTIGPRGVRLLLKALPGIPSMQKLDLDNNVDIGYKGLQMIGDDLAKQTYLIHLSLINCAIWTSHEDLDSAQSQANAEHKAGWALLQGIKRNQQIKSLKLFGIRFPRCVTHDIEYYVGLNICGRHLLSTHYHDLATGVWPYILAKCQCQSHQEANLTYFFLKERPDLIQPTTFHAPNWDCNKTGQQHGDRPRKRQRRNT